MSAAYPHAESLEGASALTGGGRRESEPELRIARPGRRKNLRAVLVLVDATAVLLAWAVAVAFWSSPAGSLGETFLRLGIVVGGGGAVTLFALTAAKLYRARVCAVRAVENMRIAKAAFLAAGALGAAIELSALPWQPGKAVAGGMLSFLFVLTGRTCYRSWMAARRRRGESLWPVVLVGANSEAGSLAQLLADHPEHGFKVTGVVGDQADAAEHVPDAPWLGELDEAPWAVKASGATGVMVAASAVPSETLNDLTRGLASEGVHVHVSSGLRGIAHNRLRAAPVAHEPLFYLEPWTLAPWQLALKRTLDVVLASVILLLALPVILVAAAVIKAQDRGPVFFTQQRVGRDGQLFTLYKFRTMVVDAEQRLKELEKYNQRDGGPLFKLAGDPRVTPIGRFFRTTSIDELPQLFNVLRGTMSLVGPRPALPREVAQFSGRLRARTQVLPGITGLWQVEARDSPSFWAYERLDMFYVENWSVGLDLSIIAGTVAVVVHRGLGAVRDVVPLLRRPPGRQQAHVID